MITNDEKYDKYYTKIDVVLDCLKHIDFSEFTMAIEPSAGCGNFSNNIPIDCVSFDIAPEIKAMDISQRCPQVITADLFIRDQLWNKVSAIEADFLTTNTDEYIEADDKVVVVGNPPFGKQASLAVKFFNKSASVKNVSSIAMVLPKSFKKPSIKDRLDLNFELEKEIELQDSSFTYGGKDYAVPCVFQIWRKTETKREKSKRFKLCNKFQFIKEEDCDINTISFRRVGVYAGKAMKYSNQSKQSHYFIICLDGHRKVDDIISSLNSLVWEHNNTTGPRSISKNELIERLNLV